MRLICKFTLCLISVMSINLLQAKTKATPTWLDAVIELRQNLKDGKLDGHLPFVSNLKKLNEDAQHVVYDLTGVDGFVIDVGDSGNGNSWDHGALADPILTDLQGNQISLLDITPVSMFGTYNSPRYNKCYDNSRNVMINGKTYDKGIFVHAVGQLKYSLGAKYKSISMDLGVDDGGSSTSSIIFQFSDLRVSESDITENLKPEDKKEFLDFLYSSKTPFLEFMLNNENVEKRIAERVLTVKTTPNTKYYTDKIKEYESLSAQDQVVAYISLAQEMMKLTDLKEKLEWINPEAMSLYLEDMKPNSSFDYAANKALLDQVSANLDEIKTAIAKGDASYIAKAENILDLRDKIIFANPLLDNEILVSQFKVGSDARKTNPPGLGTQSNNWSNQESAKRSGFDAQISILSDFATGVKLRTVYKPTNESPISDLNLHWDGDKAMFTAVQEDGRWNIFEADLLNGGAKILFDIPEPDLEFYDGTYLPDGRYIAISNIGLQGVPCVNGSDPVGNMVLYTPKDKSFRRITFDQDANWNPTITHDGKVMYTRWEYTDLTHYYSRIVMTMNPDGTEQRALYGSGYMFPNSIFDMKVIPNHSSSFVGIISGHHGVSRSGRLILFDPKKSRKGAAGMLQEIPYSNREIKEVVKDRLVDGVWPQFIKPTPIDDKYYLVAAKLSSESLWGIYLVDIFDNVTCIYEAEGEGFISPTLIRTTPTPPSIPDKVNLNDKMATVFIQDIYEGEGLPGVPHGAVKELRIFSYEYAYLSTKSDHNWHGIQSGWDIKRMLGTVPVEEDGSAIFKVPANTPIAIQPVGHDGAAIQWMRSWFTGMPGEVVSCIGCHEDLNQIAMPKRVIASTIKPREITAPEGGTRSFTFDLEIQPILDRACVACHNGDKAFDLSDNSKDQFGYGKSYLNFHPYIHRQGGEGDQTVLNPYEYHPNTSELVRMLKKGHHNVELTEAEWKKLYNWIDFNAPDKGYFNAITLNKFPYKECDQIARRIEFTNKYGLGAGVDWQKEIADYAELLKSKGEIEPVMPEAKKEAKAKNVKVKGWPFELSSKDFETKSIEVGNGVKMNFVRIPAGEFVMGSNSGDADSKPVSKVKIEKAFWMGEIEVTNEQFNVIYPEHSSRYMDQQWKDHVNPGYSAFLPEQPVIRVSWEHAMAYCQQLSKSSGLNVTLPTEAQWEWAARAGTDTDMWYGDIDADFGNKENMADKTTLLFAVAGVNPRPMNSNHSMYKHYTFLPKDESVDDGNLIQAKGGSYDANPFGLYDMHGNVAEWTRSDLLPYPYGQSKEAAEYKVVRGGSAYDRPKAATSYIRKGYYPYQQVYNVGFRVIIEE